MTEPLLQVRDLRVRFRTGNALLGRRATVDAVAGVNLDVEAGRIVAVVGESGSGKTTMARGLLRLVPATGSVRLDGEELIGLDRRRLRKARQKVQIVFQDPYASLDPRMNVEEVIKEPLHVHGVTGKAADRRVVELLEMVGLTAAHARGLPHEFSGGQRQRIAIARALALGPRLLVCDEATSALDASTQNQILELLQKLRNQLGAAYLFITHNIAVVGHVADSVAVMYLGQVVETGPTRRILERPAHPYTQALVSAVPLPNPALQRQRRRIILTGDVPDPASPPPGCPFQPRCQHAMDICRTVMPATVSLPTGGSVACHLYGADGLPVSSAPPEAVRAAGHPA